MKIPTDWRSELVLLPAAVATAGWPELAAGAGTAGKHTIARPVAATSVRLPTPAAGCAADTEHCVLERAAVADQLSVCSTVVERRCT